LEGEFVEFSEEILIKAIAQAIPVFAMSVLKNKKIYAISWGDDNYYRRMHWKAWWKLCILE
jgi:hypothetical protein